MTCKNCNARTDQNYCSNCGQPAVLKRIDAHYISHEIEHILHFERGILYTVRELLLRPGQNIREFISENRGRLVKPIIFIVVTSLVYSVAVHFFHIEDKYINFKGDDGSTATQIFKWVEGHYGYSNIIVGVFIALWAKLLFRKYDYNFFEILIMLCFVMGMGMLIFTVFVVFQGITHVDSMQVASVVSVVYLTWAIGHFFDGKKPSSYVKAIVAYMLGMLSFALLAVAVGMLIDLVWKH